MFKLCTKISGGTEIMPLSKAKIKYPDLIYPKTIYDIIGFIEQGARPTFQFITFEGMTLIKDTEELTTH